MKMYWVSFKSTFIVNTLSLVESGVRLLSTDYVS